MELFTMAAIAMGVSAITGWLGGKEQSKTQKKQMKMQAEQAQLDREAAEFRARMGLAGSKYAADVGRQTSLYNLYGSLGVDAGGQWGASVPVDLSAPKLPDIYSAQA